MSSPHRFRALRAQTGPDDAPEPDPPATGRRSTHGANPPPGSAAPCTASGDIPIAGTMGARVWCPGFRKVTVTIALLAMLIALRCILPLLAPSAEARLQALQADWSDTTPGERILQMRRLNPEYDLMARTFTVSALADRALGHPAQADEHLATMDRIIDHTLRAEERHGQAHWLLGYWQPLAVRGTGRSLFVDGEVLAMVTARRMVRDDRPELQQETRRRSHLVRSNLGSGSTLPLAESYADEGWLFCHAMALVGLRSEEVLDGADHRELFQTLRREALPTLIDPAGTGLLVSAFDMDATPGDGPEGSSIWFATTALSVLYPKLAAEQYQRARTQLGRSVWGLGYSREWPPSAAGVADVDSGPIVPFLGASVSASGFAIAAARLHHDPVFLQQLHDAQGAAEALLQLSPELSEWAANPVADSVLVWAAGVGPLYDALRLAPEP